MFQELQIANSFERSETAVVYSGDCLDLLGTIPDGQIQLVVTSPPYNIGKEYEKNLRLQEYIEQQARVIQECYRVLKPTGSICWQLGNYVEQGSIIPLDTLLHPIFIRLGMKMRNRIVWHFEHGLHASKRFSGRYETISWYTKSDKYVFNLDSVRVPQKYPGKKHFKGPKAGLYSSNPLGKNPSDVWIFPNVKSNHVEKTIHPCQFPIELVERLVLSMTDQNDWVLDPFLGVGSTIVGAILHRRRGVGAEIVPKYVQIARKRIAMAANGVLKTRPMDRPVFDPKNAGKYITTPPWEENSRKSTQLRLLDKPRSVKYHPR
jgi:adenine-specific DNA-methyltransferase